MKYNQDSAEMKVRKSFSNKQNMEKKIRFKYRHQGKAENI